jgi:hypothetical protein
MRREGRRGAAGIVAALWPRLRGCAAWMGREAARREGVAAAATSAPGATRYGRGGEEGRGADAIAGAEGVRRAEGARQRRE